MHSNNNQAEFEALRYRACPLDGSLGQVTCKPSFNLHQQKKWLFKRSVLKNGKVPVLADWQYHWQANSTNFVCWWFSVNHGRHSIFLFGTFVALLVCPPGYFPMEVLQSNVEKWTIHFHQERLSAYILHVSCISACFEWETATALFRTIFSRMFV